MNDFRFAAPMTSDGVILPPPPDETCGPDLSAPAGAAVSNGLRQVAEGLRPLGAPLFKRLQQLIIDEMPTGEHRERARAWRALARRCLKAADKHDATAERRELTERTVRAFAPEYRQHVLEQIAAGNMSVELPAENFVSYGTVRPHCGNCARVLSPDEAFRGEHYCGREPAPAWGDPENGTWRPLTDAERSSLQVLTSSGPRWLTEQEKRDGRTAEPPRWFFTSDRGEA